MIEVVVTQPTPFLYQGDVKATLWVDEKTRATFIRVQGQQVSLECFTEPYRHDFKERFGGLIKDRAEFSALQKLLGAASTTAQYGRGVPKSDGEIKILHERDSRRPLHGDPFTGFAIVDNATEEVVGRVALGVSPRAGESQAGLILRDDFHGKGAGFEAAVLASALALIYFAKRFPVGSREKKPVEMFTATALVGNEKTQKILQKLGLQKLRSEGGEGDNERCLYGIAGSQVPEQLSRVMDLSKLSCEVIKIPQPPTLMSKVSEYAPTVLKHVGMGALAWAMIVGLSSALLPEISREQHIREGVDNMIKIGKNSYNTTIDKFDVGKLLNATCYQEEICNQWNSHFPSDSSALLSPLGLKVPAFFFASLGAIGEEVLFRHFMQEEWLPVAHKYIAKKIAPHKDVNVDSLTAVGARILLTSATFSAQHLLNSYFGFTDSYIRGQLVTSFVMGIALGIVKRKSGLATTIGVHLIQNLAGIMPTLRSC